MLTQSIPVSAKARSFFIVILFNSVCF
jgi:hypothetical protein